MRHFLGLASLAISSLLSACVATPPAQVSKGYVESRTEPVQAVMQTFSGGPAIGATRSNSEMAADFLDLTFRMESGRSLPMLTRFEGPITVALIGDVPPLARMEAMRLIARLQAEAGLNINVTNGRQASVVIDFQPRSALRRAVPSAACFTVPNVASFKEYLGARRSAKVDWAQLDRRTQVAIFIPSDTSSQEVRDCLHEETAQAIGPLNDLFRLPDSVFNDDNFNSVLTGFDMLMLRVQYAGDLHSGMTQGDVAARLPGLLARINPGGESRAGAPKPISPRNWISAVESAFGGSPAARFGAAQRMMTIARNEGWTDGRLAFSYFALARAQTGRDIGAAIDNYTQAARIWRAQPGGQIHAAHVDMQLAAFALSSGRFDEVLALTGPAIPVVRQYQNASLLATMLAMRAEALDATGRDAEAQAARLDSLGWARYAFGSDAQVRARLADISELAVRGRRG